MIKPRLLLGVLATLACASCAVIPSTTFTEYRGADTITGTGGTVRTVDGVDFWETGTPNRNFRILGVIDDSRTDAPIMQLVSKDAAIARIAKEHGGDAVILIDASHKLSAVNANNGVATYRNGTKLAVVQYLP